MVKSPCKNICRYNSKHCTGCYRTIEEIASWGSLSDKEKRKIIKELPKRRMEDGQDYYGLS